MDNIKYVGMDVHKTITVIAVLNARGQMESHSKVKTKAENCHQRLRMRRIRDAMERSGIVTMPPPMTFNARKSQVSGVIRMFCIQL